MLEPYLLASVVALTVATPLLLIAGRRPTAGSGWRAATALGIVLACAPVTLLSGSAAWLSIGLVVAALALTCPRRWYAFGAVFFAALVVASAVYVAYLARATLLFATDPISLALGLVLLALELGAIGIILGGAFEMVDALCALHDEAALPPAPDRWPIVCLQVPTYNEPPAPTSAPTSRPASTPTPPQTPGPVPTPPIAIPTPTALPTTL